MKYTIDWSEKKTTSTGKEKMDCTLVDEQGQKTSGATIWADFPNYAELMNGSEVEGDLVPAKDPKYGPTLYPAKAKPAARTGGFGVKAAQERKAEMIEKAQERKEESIAFFNATNAAISLASRHPLYASVVNESELKIKIRALRDHFIKEYCDFDMPPF